MEQKAKLLPVDVYSADHGYGSMKTSEGILFPTDIVPSLPGVYGSPKEPLDRIVYSDAQGEFFVGNFARMVIESNPNAVSLTEKMNRYYFRTHAYKASMLTGIAASYPDATMIRIKVFVTGLPTAYWENDREELEDIFVGIHKFNITIGEETREMTVKIDNALVIPQPYGTLCFFAYDENGYERDTSLLTEYVGICDFGFYTTDIQLTQNGVTVPGKLESLINKHESIGETYKSIRDRVRDEIKKEIPIQVMRRQIEKGTVNYYENGKMKKYDLSAIAQEEFKHTASNVRDKVVTLWNQYDLEKVIVTGGGASISELVTPFEETFGEILKTPSQENVDSVFANAYGYKRVGMNGINSGAYDDVSVENQ